MSVLDAIVATKREDVARRIQETPLESIRRGLEASTRSLFDALSAPGARFILECKRASPSRGVIREDYDPQELAGAYRGSADALSVLTDGPYFQGALEHIARARIATDVPILCKDFVVDPYQVYEARRAGADAVLLMLSVLTDEEHMACTRAAREVGMDTLTEVHDEAELVRALRLDAPIVGINHRNLKTLEIDLGVTERLAHRIPSDRLVVAESGIHTREDLARLRPHADAFLVGSSMMSRADVGCAARALVYGRIKICGLTTPQDARAAYARGAIYGGLIFAARSERRVTEAQAREVCAGAPELGYVGVFVDETPEEIARLARALGLEAVQLHGERADVAGVRAKLPDEVRVWRTRHVEREVAIDADAQGADRVLLDARVGARLGGTGQTFDWSRLEGLGVEEMIIAGGLRPQNIARASALGAWALDVNSGVEDRPGQKNHDRLTALFDALRGPARQELY